VALRTLLQSTTETVQDLILAAEERYWEALELMVQGHPFVGIYLAGYTAEMLLKTAAFRFDGARPGDFVAPRLAPAKHYGNSFFPHVAFESAHSLRFWAAFLEQKRAAAGNPLPNSLAIELNQRVDRMHTTWWVSMRYRSAAVASTVSTAIQAETIDLLDDVDWLRKHNTDLWS